MKKKKIKLKKCSECPTKFKQANSLHVVCSFGCSLKKVDRDNKKKAIADAKKERKLTNERKLALRTKREWTAIAQTAFNAFIRERDHGLPCISCDKPSLERRTLLTGSRWDCGHFRSVGSAIELRFEPLNAHLQCSHCNNHLSGNIVEYRQRLIGRIGFKNLEWVEGFHAPKHYQIDDLKEIIQHYRKLTRELKAARAA